MSERRFRNKALIHYCLLSFLAEIASLGATLIPLAELPNRLDELDKDADIIVHCKMGGRSAKACHLLKGSGFDKVRNVRGGINAWAEQVDPSVPKY